MHICMRPSALPHIVNVAVLVLTFRLFLKFMKETKQMATNEQKTHSALTTAQCKGNNEQTHDEFLVRGDNASRMCDWAVVLVGGRNYIICRNVTFYTTSSCLFARLGPMLDSFLFAYI